GLGVVAVGELVVVVPAVLAILVAVAMRTDAREFGEGEVTGFGEFSDPNGTTAGVHRERVLASGDGDGLLLYISALLDAPFRTSWCLGVGFGGGDAVNGDEPEIAQEGLVVDAAQRGVVDDAVRARHVGCEAGEAVHRGAGFATGLGNPFDV